MFDHLSVKILDSLSNLLNSKYLTWGNKGFLIFHDVLFTFVCQPYPKLYLSEQSVVLRGGQFDPRVVCCLQTVIVLTVCMDKLV